MIEASQIREHMTVAGSDSVHVGTVDAIEGGTIKLTRSDPEARVGIIRSRSTGSSRSTATRSVPTAPPSEATKTGCKGA